MRYIKLWLLHRLLKDVAVHYNVPGTPVWFVDPRRIDFAAFQDIPGHVVEVHGSPGQPVRDAVACYSLELGQS